MLHGVSVNIAAL